MSTVLEKAHGNAEHLRRLLRIRKLEQQLRKRRGDSWFGDAHEKDVTSVIKLNERSSASPNSYRSENHENSPHHRKHRKNILCQRHRRENINCTQGRVHNGYKPKKYTTGRDYSRKWKNENNKKKSDADNSEDNIQNRLMLKVRPDMNNVSKTTQADSETSSAKDFNSLPELKKLWHDIKYFKKYASVLKENAKQNQQKTVEKTKVTDKASTSKTTQSEEISTPAATESVHHVTKAISVNVPKTAKSHIVPSNKNTYLLSGTVMMI